MKTCSKCKIEKPRSSFHKEKRHSDGLRSDCKSCAKERTDRYYQLNPHKISEWRNLNPEKHKSNVIAWRRDNHEKHKQNNNAWEAKNKNRKLSKLAWRVENKDILKISAAIWQKENSSKCAAQSAKRHAQKLKATPSWADNKKIEDFYKRAGELSNLTGIKYHVDHIVPLQGKNVCGLHVEYNLQIITASENIRKGNRFTQSHDDLRYIE